MVLSILQWNARSLIANGQELKQFIEESPVKPDIICVQETWLKPSLDFIIYGYTAVRKDRSSAIGGGVITFIQQYCNYRTICVEKNLEMVIIEIWANKTKFKIVNFYNPCQKITKEMLDIIHK